MKSNFHKSLAVRTGTFIAVCSMLFTIVLTYFFFHRAYQQELDLADKQLQQLIATMESSASVAAYLENSDLAIEVTQGLAKNDIVAGLVLVSNIGILAKSGAALLESEITSEQGVAIRHFPLASPFEPTERVGEIIIKSNRSLIEKTAQNVAMTHVSTMLIFSLAIVLLVIFLVYRLLTQPLKSLANELHSIDPGSDRRLQVPRGHKDDEIRQLVDDTNHLLESVQATLDRERNLRLEIESLGRRYRLIFENASGGIVLSNQNGEVQLFNNAFERIVGKHRIKRLNMGENLPDLFKDSQTVYNALKDAPNSKFPIALDLHLATYESTPSCWLHGLFSSVQDECGGLLIEWIVYDVSERAEREQQTLFDAEHDHLTHVFNRRAGVRYIEEALKKVQANDHKCALFLIDLDRFKQINDGYGHDAGDNVLVEVAQRLTNCLRHYDIVIRWGGDEFVILIIQGHGSFEVVPVAEKILSRLVDKAINLGDGQQDHIGASIGISIFPEHGTTMSELLEKADTAMYKVKEAGRNDYLIHSSAAK